MKVNRKLLDQAPDGMYAVAKIEEGVRDIIEPGVIFTLRQVEGRGQSKEQNPLFPYYMVYITDQGQVKLSFLHAKNILDYYKKLCSGQNKIMEDIVKEFNKETNDGRKMEHYSDLLGTAIENLLGKKQEVGLSSLFSKGGTTMQKNFLGGLEDFELITFLVIKD